MKLLQGPLSDDVARELAQILNQIPAQYFNLLFMNHSMKCYLPHFMFLKDRGMLGKGTVIVANSDGFPKHQEYLKYLNEHPDELETKTVKSMAVSTYK